MMTDYGMTAEEVAKDLGDQLDPRIQSYIKSAKNGEITTEGFNKSIGNLSLGAKAGQVALDGLALAGNALASIGISVAIAFVTKVITSAINSEKEMSEAINTASEKLDEQTSSLDSNMQKLSELRTEIDSGNLSYEDAATKRSELIDIQSSLIETYGEEAKGIDLVNGSLEEQLGLLDELKRQKIQDAVNAGNKRGWWGNFINGVGNVANLMIVGAWKALTSKAGEWDWKWDSDYWGTGTSISKSRNKYNNYSKKFNVTNNDEINKYIESFDNIERIGNKFKISGDADKVKDTIAEIQRTLKGSSEYAGDLELRLANIYNNASDYSDNWKNGNDLYYLDKIVNDDELYDYYERGAEAYDDYQKAVESGNEEDKNKAIEDYKKLLSEMTESGVQQGVFDYITSLAPGLQSVLDDWVFTVKVQPQLDNSNSDLSKDADLLNGFSADELSQKWDDLSNGVAVGLTEAQQQALFSLNTFATQYGFTLDELLSKLESLGYLKDPLISKREEAQKYITGSTTTVDARTVAQKKQSAEVLAEEEAKIYEWGLDKYADQIKNQTIPSQYGNVDMDNRQVIDWNIENIEKWKDALQDIKYYDDDGNFIDSYYDQLKESAENGYTNIDTVFGDMIDHIEGYGDITAIAFSHVVNNDDGTFEFLGQKTAEEYLNGILDEAKKDGDMSIDHILELDKKGLKDANVYDAQGKVIGQTYVHGIISGFNENASDISKLTHFSGKFGAWQLGEYKPSNEEEINDYINDLSGEDLDIVLSMSVDEKSKIETKQDLENFIKEQKSAANNELSELDSFLSNNKDIEKKLFNLSKSGKLDEDTLKSVEKYDDLLAACGNDADKLIENIKKLADQSTNSLDATNNLTTITGGLDSLSEVYSQAHNKTYVESDAITALYDQFGDLDVFDNFVEAMQNIGNANYDTAQSFNDLADAYVNAHLPLSDLTDATKQQYIEELKANGISNAEEAITERLAYMNKVRADAVQELAQSQQYANITTQDLEQATVSEISQMITAAEAEGLNTKALGYLAAAKIKSNSTQLNEKTTIEELITAAKAAGVASTTIEAYEHVKNYVHGQDLENVIKSTKESILRQLTDFDFGFKPYEYNGVSPKTKSNSGSSSSDNSKDEKDTSKEYDWIAIAIQRCEEEIERLSKVEENTYIWWSKRNKALLGEINQTTREIELLQHSYDGYMNAANTVGLSDEYKQKVINGTIQIETVTDENLQKQIDAFQQWWEKARDCKDKIDELNISLSKLAEQKFDNIVSHFEEMEKSFTDLNDILDSKVKLAEAKGRVISSSYYNSMIKNEKKNYDLLVKQKKDMEKSLEEAVASGRIQQGSEAWYNMKSQINEVEKAIIDAKTSLQEFQNQIRQLKWDKFDSMMESVTDLADEIDWLNSLFEDDSLTDGTKSKGLTNEGEASMGAHAKLYQIYVAQRKKYASEIKKLDKEIAKDPANQDLIERRKELIKSQRDVISSIKSEKDAMIDLARQGYDAVLESLQDLIDKRKDALDSEKELYEYQKSIAEKTKNIATLRKQLSVFENDDSEEARKKVQQLKVDLADAEQDLKDTEYDKYISDQEDMLDKLYQDYSDKIDEKFEQIDKLFDELLKDVDKNSGVIDDTLRKLASQFGYDLSDEAESTIESNNINTTLNKIYDTIDKIYKIADKEAYKAITGKDKETFEEEIIHYDPTYSKNSLSPTSMSSVSSNIAKKLSSSIDYKLNSLSNSISTIKPNMTLIDDKNNGNFSLSIDNINLPNVSNPEDFSKELLNALKNDTKIIKTIRSATTDQIVGKNSKRINRY